MEAGQGRKVEEIGGRRRGAISGIYGKNSCKVIYFLEMEEGEWSWFMERHVKKAVYR